MNEDPNAILSQLIWLELTTYLGSYDAAQAWYTSYNTHLNGTPCDMDQGKVLDYIDRFTNR